MKRFSFNTFLAGDGNRVALDVCRRIADLEPVAPMPVLLLGEEGCGKTHLLYSIWKRVKATSPRTSLAVVTAREFRREIRDLIGEPAPVEKAESAILLIDQLEQFETMLDELEAVVRIFLDNNHAVMLASNVHPRRLNALPQGLKDMVAEGQTVQMRLLDGETQLEVLRREIRSESQAVLEKQRSEIDRLRALLERVSPGPGSDQPDSVREALDAERARAADLTKQLETATAFAHSLEEETAMLKRRLESNAQDDSTAAETLARLESEAAQAREELAAARNEAETLRRELESRSDGEEEIEQLRAALETAQAQKESALAQAAAEHEATRRQFEEETARLGQELEAARQECAQARHEANMLLERAEKLVSQIENNQTRFRETEQEQRRQIEELEALLAAGVPSQEQGDQIAALQEQLAEAVKREEDAREAFDRERRELAERLARNEEHIEQELSAARNQAEEAQRALEEVSAQRDQLHQSLESANAQREELRGALAGVHREREDLQDAITQVHRELDEARAALDDTHRQREELERALQETHTELDSLRESCEQAGRARDEAQAALEESRNRLEETESQALRAEQRLAEQSAEMDSLRHDAAAQVAQANAQAGELEGQLAQLQTRLDKAIETGSEMARQLQETRTELLGSADAVDSACQRLAALGVEEVDEPADASWVTHPGDVDQADHTPNDSVQQNPETEPAAQEPQDTPPPDNDDDDAAFDQDRMVLPPAPDEEDIEDDANPVADTGESHGTWDPPKPPGALDLPETPLGPLEDLSPLEDDRE